jgi:hypothetical protein
MRFPLRIIGFAPFLAVFSATGNYSLWVLPGQRQPRSLGRLRQRMGQTWFGGELKMWVTGRQ